MRHLIFFSLFFFVGSAEVWAATSLIFESKYTHVKQPLRLSSNSNGHDLSTLSAKSGIRSDLGPNLSSEFSLSLVHADYRNLQLKDRGQNPKPINNPRPYTKNFEGSLSWNQGPRGSSLGLFSNLGLDIYATQGFSIGYFESFYNKSSVLGFTYTGLRQKAPEDFFIDKDFQIKARPQRIHAQELSSYFEQSFTEDYKARLSLNAGERKEERPYFYGAKLRQALAFSDQVFSQLELGFIRESRRDRLKNERGYFEAKFLKISGSFEIFYDFILSPAYTLMVEHERDPRSNTKMRIGSDQYSLGASYDLSSYTLRSEVQYYATNSSSQGYSIQGTVQWKL